MNPISGIRPELINSGNGITGKEAVSKDFTDRFKEMLGEVNEKQHEADTSTEKVIRGELGIHEGMLSIHEADVSLRYLIKVREKVMAAYDEIRKMSV